MSQKKQKITRIEQPKTQSRAERLHYLAQLRGEIEEEKPQLNKKKFIIISLIILALLAGILVYSNYMLDAIESANVDHRTTSRTLLLMLGRDPEVILGGSDAVIDEELARVNAWSSIFLVARNSNPFALAHRSSMNVTFFEGEPGRVHVSAITSGGSQAMFFKVNTWGEETFLDKLRDVLDRFRTM